MQGRVAERVDGIELGVGFDQDRNDLQIAVQRRIMHRGARVIVDLVRIAAAAADELSDLLRIVLRGRARDVVVKGAERIDVELSARGGPADDKAYSYQPEDRCPAQSN